MTEKLTNNIITEVDYKHQVMMKTGNKAKLEVVTSGYFSHNHKEYRVFLDEAGERREYLSNVVALTEEDAWKYADAFFTK